MDWVEGIFGNNQKGIERGDFEVKWVENFGVESTSVELEFKGSLNCPSWDS